MWELLFCVSSKLIDLIFVGGSVLILRDLPHGLHHLDEVLIISDSHAYIGVVVNPFFPRDNSVIISFSTIEFVQELLDNLFFGFATFEKISMIVYAVDMYDIWYSNLTWLIFIHDAKAFLYHV